MYPWDYFPLTVKGVDQDKVEKQQTEDKVPEDKPAQQPVKKKEDTQVGQPKPESAKKENPTGTDNTNHDPDLGGVSDADWAAAGWTVVADPEDCNHAGGSGLYFE